MKVPVINYFILIVIAVRTAVQFQLGITAYICSDE